LDALQINHDVSVAILIIYVELFTIEVYYITASVEEPGEAAATASELYSKDPVFEDASTVVSALPEMTDEATAAATFSHSPARFMHRPYFFA
jgi:hypothetical protein